MVAAGGLDHADTTPSGSPRTPDDISANPVGQCSGGPSSKRTARDTSINSPRKKSSRVLSIDETIESINNVIQRSEQRIQKRQEKDNDEEDSKVN